MFTGFPLSSVKWVEHKPPARADVRESYQIMGDASIRFVFG
jgi:hypothetical protein